MLVYAVYDFTFFAGSHSAVVQNKLMMIIGYYHNAETHICCLCPSITLSEIRF